MSVRYKRLTWSSWRPCQPCKHSLRATSSGRFELSPSSSLPTLLDSRVRCSYRGSCGSGTVVYHFMALKLQKHVPIDLGGGWDGNPGIRAPGHRIPGPWSQGIFLFCFFNFFGGSSFFSKKMKTNFVFSLYFLSFSLSFSVHTDWVLFSLINFKVGLSNNNSHLNFRFRFLLINGLIDDKFYVPR